jgi:microcystin-dependent protein
MIMLWSGSTASIPTGWTLCDGTSGTPDLRNRFVVGAGDAYAVDATGGSADATLPSHTHTATSTVTDPGHLHTTNVGSANNSFDSGTTIGDDNPGTTGSNTTGITVSTSLSTEGSSATNANLPPYYALAYIMKL